MNELQLKGNRISTTDICYAGFFTAVIAVTAQISIPMPLGVPVTLQTFAIILSAVVLGAKRSAIATVIYLALGAIGLPVLSNFSGGLFRFVGPTGGFLLSFPIMAYIIGFGAEHRSVKGVFTLSLIIGILDNYAVGVIMFSLLMKSSLYTAISACVIPFIPTDIIKAVTASILGFAIKKYLP